MVDRGEKNLMFFFSILCHLLIFWYVYCVFQIYCYKFVISFQVPIVLCKANLVLYLKGGSNFNWIIGFISIIHPVNLNIRVNLFYSWIFWLLKFSGEIAKFSISEDRFFVENWKLPDVLAQLCWQTELRPSAINPILKLLSN